MFQIKPAFQGLVMAAMFGTALLMTAFVRPDAQEISFQTFKMELLGQRLVERIEVVNKSLVKVYVKRYPHTKKDTLESKYMVHPISSKRHRLALDETMFDEGEQRPPETEKPALASIYKFFFHIGSVDSFERQLEESQKQFGIEASDFIPVKYITQWSIVQELIRYTPNPRTNTNSSVKCRFAPTLLLIGAYVWFTRKSMGGTFGGGSTRGGRNFFNVGKAHVRLFWCKPSHPGVMCVMAGECDRQECERQSHFQRCCWLR